MKKIVAWIVDHPWVVIGAVVLVTIGALVAIPHISTQTKFKDYLSDNDPAVAAMNRVEDRYGKQTFFMVSVVAPDTIFKTETLEKIVAMRKEFEEIPGVKDAKGPINSQVIVGTEKSLLVGPAAPNKEVPKTPEAMAEYRDRVMSSNSLRGYIVSEDGKAATISIELKTDADEKAIARKVIEIVDRYKGGPEKIYIAGMPYMSVVLSDSMGKDLKVLLPIAILVIVIVLYFSFHSLRGVLLPLTVVLLSAAWAMGAMALAHVPMTIMSFIMPIILLAIGIAYCIHVLNKYYEEISLGKSKRETVIETTMMMVSPVSMAGLTTIAGFLSLLNSFLIPQQQFGLFTALGVLVAMVLSLTLIPALLSVMPLPKRKMKGKEGWLGKGLGAFERVVARYPKAVVALSVVIIIAFGFGTTMVKVETQETEFLGKDHPIVQAMDVMDDYFSGSGQVMVEFDTGTRNGLKDPKLLQRIVAFEEWLKDKPGVKINKTMSLADMVCEMNQKFHADDPSYYRVPDDPKLTAQLLLLFTFQGGDLGSMALGDFSAGEVTGMYSSAVGSNEMVQLAKDVQAYLDENFPDVQVEMVGATRLAGSMMSKMVKSQISSLLTAMVAAGLIVALLMRSPVAGLISIIPLVLTILITFGIMGFTGTPLDMSTLMISSIAIGIGIDYAIHFIDRFRKEYRKDRDERRALEATVHSTGRGIAFNAIALALGFGVLLFSSFKGTSNFGLMIAATMVISALAAFTTIPAILVLWKPKFLTANGWKKKEVVRTGEFVESEPINVEPVGADDPDPEQKEENKNKNSK
jgi:hypothetical protein